MDLHKQENNDENYVSILVLVKMREWIRKDHRYVFFFKQRQTITVPNK